MAKMKLDLSRVKTFMFEKGEKVALIACTGLMVLIVGYSLYSGMGSRGADSGKPWDVAIEDESKKLKDAIGRADLREDEIPPPISIELTKWGDAFKYFPFAQLFVLPDRAFTKKLNPVVLSVRPPDEEKRFQLDYVRGLYYAYEIDVTNQKATIIAGEGGGAGMAGAAAAMAGGGKAAVGGKSNLAKIVKPTRMVVVSATFPMRDQLDEFRKALRYATLEEMLSHRNELPKPEGLEVSRCEILRDGSATKWTHSLFKYEKNGKLTVTPGIREMMRHMLIDDENPQSMAGHVFPGLVTPLPKLANTKYAKLDLTDFQVKEVVAAAEGGVMVPPGAMGSKGGIAMPVKAGNKAMAGMQQGNVGGGGAEVQLRKETWKNLTKELSDKFNERYSMFDPFGQNATVSVEKKAVAGGSTAMAMMQQVASGAGGTGAAAVIGWEAVLGGANPGVQPGVVGKEEGANPEEEKTAARQTVQIGDALVRFFDPDVQPGKTYRYVIRIRMANPNYDKHDAVAFKALADVKHLDPLPDGQLGWRITPAITIPGDYDWYAIDQAPEVKIKGGADYATPGTKPETVPVQVHRWMDRVPDLANGIDYLVADWAIAERLYVRRGDTIGRSGVMIEMPTWNMGLQRFEIGTSGQTSGKSKKPAQPDKNSPIVTGIPVDLNTAPPWILIDFDGGKRTNALVERRDGAKEYVNDASALDVLVLSPEGKLVVRNNRTDADPESTSVIDARTRFEQWRDRIAALRSEGGGATAAPPAKGKGEAAR